MSVHRGPQGHPSRCVSSQSQWCLSFWVQQSALHWLSPWASVFTSDPGLHTLVVGLLRELNMIMNAEHLAHCRCLTDIDWPNGILKIWRARQKAASRNSDCSWGMDGTLGRQAGQMLEPQRNECDVRAGVVCPGLSSCSRTNPCLAQWSRSLQNPLVVLKISSSLPRLLCPICHWSPFGPRTPVVRLTQGLYTCCSLSLGCFFHLFSRLNSSLSGRSQSKCYHLGEASTDSPACIWPFCDTTTQMWVLGMFAFLVAVSPHPAPKTVSGIQ